MKSRPALMALLLLGSAASGSMSFGQSGTAGGQADTAAAPADMTPTKAMPFVTMAGASDLYEIQSSQIALSKSRNADVRSFAQMMIDHHTRTTQQVTAAATSAGLAPAQPKLTPMQTDMIGELQKASADDFDKTYLGQQRRAHEMALALHSNYAKNGDTPALRQAASTAVPVVRQHLGHIRSLAS